jgi:fructose-bisphosphate aldolase class I
MGCLIAAFGTFFPRLAVLLSWLAHPVRFSDAFDGDFLWPLPGVAFLPVNSLLRAVPVAVPAIAFLSAGQPAELATARLNALNVGFKSLPWALALSFARAIQQPALEIWQGKQANVKAAQQALLHRARCNQAARRGDYSTAMESPRA